MRECLKWGSPYQLEDTDKTDVPGFGDGNRNKMMKKRRTMGGRAVVVLHCDDGGGDSACGDGKVGKAMTSAG